MQTYLDLAKAPPKKLNLILGLTADDQLILRLRNNFFAKARKDICLYESTKIANTLVNYPLLSSYRFIRSPSSTFPQRFFTDEGRRVHEMMRSIVGRYPLYRRASRTSLAVKWVKRDDDGEPYKNGNFGILSDWFMEEGYEFKVEQPVGVRLEATGERILYQHGWLMSLMSE